MQISTTLFCTLFAVGTALADPYVMAKQQARRTSDQNAAEQQRIAQQTAPPAAAAAAAPAPSAAPVNPALAATMQNIADLRADLAAFSESTHAVPDATQNVSLLNHLSAAAQGTKPAVTNVKKFAEDLITAVSGKKLTPAQRQKLARDVHAVFNGAHLTAAQQKMMADDAGKILTDASVAPENIASVTADFKAMAAETQ